MYSYSVDGTCYKPVGGVMISFHLSEDANSEENARTEARRDLTNAGYTEIKINKVVCERLISEPA